MKIQGKRGKVGLGFSIKKRFYVYVWKRKSYETNKEQIKERRKINKEYNYSSGWNSIGRVDDPSTVDILHLHLKEQYGYDIDKQEIQEQLQKKFEEQEARRIERERENNILNR